MTTGQLTLDELAAEEPLASVTFVIVDLETTGGPATEAGITEIGAVKVRGGQTLGEFATLVDPDRNIPAHIQAMTGITPGMLRDAPSVAGAVASFGEFAGDAILVAHNAPYDLGFLKAACARPQSVVVSGTVVGYRSARACGAAPGRSAQLQIGHARPVLRLARHTRSSGTRRCPRHHARAAPLVRTRRVFRCGHLVGPAGIRLAGIDRAARETPSRGRSSHWAGVYTFVDAQGAPLYIGTSRNVRSRVRSYFSAAEQRARMTEMIGIAKQGGGSPRVRRRWKPGSANCARFACTNRGITASRVGPRPLGGCSSATSRHRGWSPFGQRRKLSPTPVGARSRRGASLVPQPNSCRAKRGCARVRRDLPALPLPHHPNVCAVTSGRVRPRAPATGTGTPTPIPFGGCSASWPGIWPNSSRLGIPA